MAAAVNLAGVEAEVTQMEIWAAPTPTRNKHTVQEVSGSSEFTMTIQGRPCHENPATGRITPQCVIAFLQQMNATVKVGI